VNGSVSAVVSSAARHNGAYGLQDYGGNDWIYRNDSAVTVQRGDTVSTWVRFASLADGRAYFGFGAKSSGTMSLVAAANTNQLIIQNNTSWGYGDVAAVSQTWLANHWYRLEVSLGTGSIITARLFDSDGTTLLKTVTGSSNAFSAGGIAFRAIGSTKYWDTVTLTHAAGGLSANSASSPSRSGARGDEGQAEGEAPGAVARGAAIANDALSARKLAALEEVANGARPSNRDCAR